MSFSQIEIELKEVKEEIKEIHQSIKQLIIQMKLVNMTFKGTLKSRQKREYTPFEIKILEKITPRSDDEKYIKRYQARLLKAEEESQQKILDKQKQLKGKDKQEESGKDK